MCESGQLLVDGFGAERVAAQLSAQALTLRNATESDCRLLWEWVNDPQVRASSFSSDPIPWDHHRVWFSEKLAAPNCVILIGMDESGSPVGQVRFDWNDSGEAEVDITVAPSRRGNGFGSKLILRSANEVFATTAIWSIRAYIKPDNIASVRAFEKAGFRPLGQVMFRDQLAEHLIMSRNEY